MTGWQWAGIVILAVPVLVGVWAMLRYLDGRRAAALIFLTFALIGWLIVALNLATGTWAP